MADNPIDIWGAVNVMKQTKGWGLLMERYAKEGDELLTKILDTFTHEDARRLYVFQLEALGRLAKVLGEMEQEAKNEMAAQNAQKHIGK